MKKEFFSKNRGDFVFLKRFHQKKNTNRRNMRERVNKHMEKKHGENNSKKALENK